MNRLLVLILIATALACAVTATASWIARKRAPLALTAGSAEAPLSKSAEDRAMLLAQLRAVAAVVFCAAMFLILLRPSVALTGLVGLPLALAAGLSASAGLLLYSALPPAKLPAFTRSSASLVPRKPWSFGVRRTFAVPFAVVLAYIAFLVATGLTSSQDGQGRYRVLRIEDTSSTVAATSYPGWFYGVPLMLVTLVLSGSALLALHRIASTPALPDPRMAAMDRRWREVSTRVVVRLGTGALLGYFGGTAMVAGQAMINVAMSFGDGGQGYRQPLYGLGVTCAAAGAALALAGVVLLVLAARGTLTIRAAARQGAREPASAA